MGRKSTNRTMAKREVEEWQKKGERKGDKVEMKDDLREAVNSRGETDVCTAFI